MALRRCCVVNCHSTNKSHRLFNIPKTDSLRALWLSFLIPTTPRLSDLTKEQLVTKLVCQKHFDRFQFDGKGNRLKMGYPCLFTEKEILHGIPLNSSVTYPLSDHSYYAATSVTDHLTDHSYYSTTSPNNNATDSLLTVEGDEATSSFLQPTKPIIVNVDTTTDNIGLPVVTGGSESMIEIPTKSLPPSSKKTVSSQRNKKYNTAITVVKKKQQENADKPFQERYESAKACLKNQKLFKNVNDLSTHARNFLFMQLRLVNKKKKGVTFTTDEKLLALLLMKESPKGYRLLQKLFRLPSKRTLNRLAEKISFHPGINKNVFRLLENEVKKWDLKRKLCSIVFDEVSLTSHLTYIEKQDLVRGFKDLGEERELTLADHALVFMLRGVCANWRQPVAYYFCEGTISSQALAKILKDIVTHTAQAGLTPIALVCDQGSTFRSCLKTMRQDTEVQRNLIGKHNDGTLDISGCNLSVVFDPPHLLKGIRNNFLTKNMIFKGKVASWDDIEMVYKTDCQLGHTKMNCKLTDQHVIPSKIKKMKVKHAAQVLSAQTSAMLKYTSLFDSLNSQAISTTMATTGEAVEFFDKLFDSVNGSRRGSCRGKLRGAIKPNSKHYEFWFEAKKILQSIKFIDTKSKKAVTNNKTYNVRVPSLDSWIVTIESIERIAKLLFQKYNVKYIYPRHINQDPLENFFGRIRALNYRNVNPDSFTFVNAFKSLLISNVMGPHSLYSNCEEDDGETFVDFLKLIEVSDDENKENINFLKQSNIEHNIIKTSNQTSISLYDNVFKEKIKVHSSAYTAGYICRKITKKINCNTCKKTYTSKETESIHKWIAYREYKELKNKNLAYPSSQFLVLYRNTSSFIHNFLNENAHHSQTGSTIKSLIRNQFDFEWLGCGVHKNIVVDYFIVIITRIHVHNWCNIINKILRGAVDEKYVNKMCVIHKKALDKYKKCKSQNKNKI